MRLGNAGLSILRDEFLSRLKLPKYLETGERHGETDDLANELRERYEKWEAPPRVPNSIAIFAPTLLMFSSEGADETGHFEQPDVSQWLNGLLHLCLYVDRVWVPDPVEILVHHVLTDELHMQTLAVHEPLLRHKGLAFVAAKELNALNPLIESGVIALYPALTCYERWVAEGLWGTVRGYSRKELREAWPNKYVEEGILFAEALKASYTALHPDEHLALVGARKEIDTALGFSDQRTIASLPLMKLPYFEGLDAKILRRARSNEKAFEDFRTFLRELTAKLPGGLEDPGFLKEVDRLERDAITPALRQLTDDVTGVTFLKKRLTDMSLDFVAGAMAGIAMKADVADALLAGTITTLAKGLVKIYSEYKPSRPAASVIYSFHTGRPLSRVL